MKDKLIYYLFNWSETDTIDLTINLQQKSQLTDFWTNEKLGTFGSSYTEPKLAPHTTRLIEAKAK